MSTVHAVARDHCLAPERVNAPVYGGRYRKLFAELPALECDESALHALVGIVDADPESFRSAEPHWTPTLPSHEPGRFGLADILLPAPE